MNSYYSEKLSAQRLKLCYDLGQEAVQRYLSDEIQFVCTSTSSSCHALELGCGYGRVLQQIAPFVRCVIGIDTSIDSLCMARKYLAHVDNFALVNMDATSLAFPDGIFDLVFCVQNGIAAFQVDPKVLLSHAIAATKEGGKVLFSTYADEFWEHRLEWFRVQAAHGLVGKIDEAASRRGVIVCEDGFSSGIIQPHDLFTIAQGLGKNSSIHVIGGSSVFCEVNV